MKLISKYQEGTPRNGITLANDAIKSKPIRVKPITTYSMSPNSEYVHEVTLDPKTGQYEIGVNYPGLTQLQQKDKSAVERLRSRLYTNRQYLDLQRQIHNSNQRDIALGTAGAGLATAGATLLTMGAASPMGLGYSPMNIAGVASGLGGLMAAKSNYDYSTPNQYLDSMIDLAGITPILNPGLDGITNAIGNLSKLTKQLQAQKFTGKLRLPKGQIQEWSDGKFIRVLDDVSSAQSAVVPAATQLPTGQSRITKWSPLQLEHYLSTGRVTLKELEEVLSKGEARKLYEAVVEHKDLNTKLKQDYLKKATSGNKGKKGVNKEIVGTKQIINQHNPSYINEEIRKQYADQIREILDRTGIDWSDQSDIMKSMPDKLKASKVGFDDENPFLKRYYDNVIEITKEGGFQDQLLKSGDLRVNANGLWEGKFKDGYRLVYPTDYVKMRLANSKGYNFDIKERVPGAPNYPMHGTRTDDYHYLTKPSSSAGQAGYFTVIQDAQGIDSGLMQRYKGAGASVPFFRMPDYEVPLLPRGNHSSNAYGYPVQPLLNWMRVNRSKILMPIDVQDPNSVKGRVNEYDIGSDVPNPKSLWNTLDFIEGAGPLSYNTTKKDNNYV